MAFSFDKTIPELLPFKVHEGYSYTVAFDYKNNIETAVDGVVVGDCEGRTIFTLKIVPEYMNFVGGRNWNNDENWVRSTKEALYKSADVYENYMEKGLIHKGLTPMKFTKVVIDQGVTPWLYSLPYKADGSLDLSVPRIEIGAATTAIEYDMLVRVDKEDNRFYCERFYGNTCDQIYFRPNAELLNQHHLIYNKAWVDLELKANRWYTLSSPLQGVVAGDMYLPYPSRRQESEAFEPIIFDASLSTNNRALVPVFQRSFERSGTVLKQDGSNYDAWNGVDGTWSNVYNDVNVNYSSDAFSIKADRREKVEEDGEDKVLFRLPKADTSYRYYAYGDDNSGVNSGEGHTTTLSRMNPGKLIEATTSEGAIRVPITMKEGTEHVLVSNPYMVSIDMSLFFEYHSDRLHQKYWVVNADEQRSFIEITNLGVISPLQSFFVSPIEGVTLDALEFTPDMFVRPVSTAGLGTRSGVVDTPRNPILTLSTTNNQVKSETKIVIKPNSAFEFDPFEDAEMLFDSNLTHTTQLYTVAGNQAAAISTIPQLTTIPLGITSPETKQVAVRVDGLATLNGALRLYDAEVGRVTPLTEGATLYLQAPSVGRYFLLGSDESGEADSSLSLTTDGLKVHLSLNRGEILRVRGYNAAGVMVEDKVVNRTECTLRVIQSGIYTLTVTTDGGQFVRKVHLSDN